MSKPLAIVVAILCIPLLVFGLVFLIAAVSAPSRLVPGLVLIAIGVVLLVTAIRRLRRLAEISPEALKTGAVELARRLGGEVTEAQLRAEYRIPLEQATNVLEGLVADGTARREDREDRTVYVISGLAASLAKKRCPYCGTELPMRSDLRKCPNCGGQLEITKT